MNVIGIGTDIVEIARIQGMVQRHGELFVQRVYTQHEIDYCSSKKMAMQHYAGRWAAKEAVLKALGTGWIRGISWRDVEVYSHPGGKPSIRLAGGARTVCEKMGIGEIFISISHCRTNATAYALAVGPGSSEPDDAIEE
ncbi:MAG: holo-ACP synthase [Planctomycetales bacterium]|nr:holo-ACP synthase [Planctomycetales bacterium]